MLPAVTDWPWESRPHRVVSEGLGAEAVNWPHAIATEITQWRS
jgi:hypothetical protein